MANIPAAWQSTDTKVREDLRRVRVTLEQINQELKDTAAAAASGLWTLSSDPTSPIVVNSGSGPDATLYFDNAELEAGGSQPLDVGGLSGVLADSQVANKIVETSGPTTLTVGAVADGEFLRRSGSTVIGATAAAGSDLTPGSTVLDDDPYYPYNTALLHCNGSNASTSFPDQMGNSWTANGNAQVSTSSPKFGSGSMLLDGTGDYLSATISSLIGIQDFCVEAWIKPVGVASAQEILCIGTISNTSQFNLVFEITATGALRGSIQDGSGGSQLDISSSAAAITAGSWQHVAFTAEGTTARLRVNGTVVQTGTVSGTRVQNNTSVRIGHLSTASGGTVTRYFNGNIDDVRVTKGWCRYSGSDAVSAPSAAFPSAPTLVLDSTVSTTGSNDAQGVASDGTNIFYTTSLAIYKYTNAGSLVTSRTLTADFPLQKTTSAGGPQINGCYYDPDTAKLYVSAARFTNSTGVSWILEYDPSTLALLAVHTLPNEAFSEGVARKYGYWWVCFHANRYVCRYDDDWQLISTYPLSYPITGSSGGYGAATGYDGIAWVDDYLFLNVHETYNEDYTDIYAWDGSGFREIARIGRVVSALATQGLAVDASDPTIMWMALRNSGGTDGYAKARLV